MAATIIDTGGDKQIQMVNARFARIPLAGLFTGPWQQLRVCLLCWPDTAADQGVGADFSFGLCSGTSNIPGDATATHAIGFTISGGMVKLGTGPVSWVSFNNFFKQIGATITLSATINTMFWPITSAQPTCFFVDITKGSPNYSFKMFSPTAKTAVATQADFETQSITATPSLSGHTWSAASTIAVDEATNGTFDAMFCNWDMATPTCNIAEIRVVKLA